MAQERIFAEGFYYDLPKDGAPQHIVGAISVKVDDAIAFLKKHERVSGYVNLDIKMPREGNRPYLELNTWQPEKPKSVQEQPVEKVEYPENDLPEVPF